ncbi:hypothetical protein V6N13_091739 [Hibiscus sabdariffa]
MELSTCSQVWERSFANLESSPSPMNSKSGSNLPKVIWRIEILEAVVCSKSGSKGGNVEISKAIDPEEPTDEDMNTFFSSLDSELLSSGIVVSQEEAKEALAKLIDEALDMTPVNFYYSGKFSPLQQAFKILASFNCSSTTLTIAQQNELMTMGESLKELVDRAAKAVQEKTHLTAKESIKMMITRNLDRNTTRYKEVKLEVKQVEQKLSALLAEQKDIFTSSKGMKMELEALGEKWAEFEAKAKVAEEEEKAVEEEWGRMKDLMSCIKRMI